MSYDLDVVTHATCPEASLHEALERRGYQLTRNAVTASASAATAPNKEGQPRLAFTLDGPLHVEVDDLDPSLCSYVLAPRWIYQLSVPSGSTQRDVAAAKELAKRIAEEGQGAVYDPQADRILWPRTRVSRSTVRGPARGEAPLRLTWLTTHQESGRGVAKTFLDEVRRLCPEARPIRFGSYEPMQGRLSDDDDEPFLALAEQESRRPSTSFFWKAGAPFGFGTLRFGAAPSVTVSPVSQPARSGHALCPTVLSVDVSVSTIEQDSAWREALVLLLGRIALGVNAFFACAGTGMIIHGPHWLGLPATRTWLNWYGPPYLPELEGSLTHAQSFQGGLLLRIDEALSGSLRLGERAPELPPHLIANYLTEPKVTAAVIPQMEAPT